MEKEFVYHATDLINIPSILKAGLHGGNDGGIWAYEKLSQTVGMMMMMDIKKHWQNAFAAIGADPPRWRNFIECGFGVIQIDCRGIQEYAQPYRPSTHWRISRPNPIPPQYLSFLGKWDEKAHELCPVDLRPFEWVFDRYFKKLDMHGTEVHLSDLDLSNKNI